MYTNEKAMAKINTGLSEILYDKREQKKLIAAAGKFGMQSGEVMDYIAGRRLIEHADPQRIFIITKALDENLIPQLFTPLEIEKLSKAKLKQEKVELPIIFNCVQVADDQWIGVTDMTFLMRLYNSQLIRYNENTQRTMQRVIRKNNAYYRIAVNKRAVRAITAAIINRTYIPNTITLNIPEETEFSYDSESATLTITDISMFDIADGYHRLIAMSRVYAADPDFNIPIELRIISFNESKTRQFIYQEDQKTKMKKVDSESMNAYDPTNRVVERLNDDGNFLAQGMISRNDGVINYGELSKAIRWYFPPQKGDKKQEVHYIVETEKRVLSILNSVISDHMDLLEKKITFNELVSIFYCSEVARVSPDTLLSTADTIRVKQTRAAYEREFQKKGG